MSGAEFKTATIKVVASAVGKAAIGNGPRYAFWSAAIKKGAVETPIRLLPEMCETAVWVGPRVGRGSWKAGDPWDWGWPDGA